MLNLELYLTLKSYVSEQNMLNHVHYHVLNISLFEELQVLNNAKKFRETL